MKIINSYMKYIYIVLIVALLAAIAALIMRLLETMKKINLIVEDAGSISAQAEKANEKLAFIKSTGDSYKFFLSAIAVYIILNETFKYSKSEGSLTKSFTKAIMRNSSKIGKIRI